MKYVSNDSIERPLAPTHIYSLLCCLVLQKKAHITKPSLSLLLFSQAVNVDTKEAVAIKVLDKEKIQQQNMGQQIKKEISIMKVVR